LSASIGTGRIPCRATVTLLEAKQDVDQFARLLGDPRRVVARHDGLAGP